MFDRGERDPLLFPMVATLLGGAVYAAAVVWSNRHPSWMTLFLAVLPFAWFAVAYAKGALPSAVGLGTRLIRLMPLALILFTLGTAWTPLARNVQLLYFTQHVAIHAALFWIFARTLTKSRTPLCTELASWVHEDMTSPNLLRYTRQVTIAWTIFFALVTVGSVALFFGASAEAWTLFAAVLCPILTAAFFLIENLLRSHFLPPADRVGLAGTWRAVQARLRSQGSARAAHRVP